MTILTPALLTPANTLVNIFTAGVGKGNGNAVVLVSFCNTTSTAATVYLYVSPSPGSLTSTTPGGSAADSPFILINGITVAGNDTFVFNAEKLLLSSGDKLWAASNTNNTINAIISYLAI